MAELDVRLADVVAVACAEAFRGDGEIFASGMGTMPMLGARLARATFEPDLLVSDGEAFFVSGDLPVGSSGADKVIEGWIPFRSVFDTLWGGRRHVMMGATQIDQHGNQNISAIGEFAQPKRMLLGSRGAPGNTINHRTSYWVPKHPSRVFVPQVDIVSGVGRARAEQAGPAATRFHDLHRIVTNLAVLDAQGPAGTLRLVSVHPGVTVEDVTEASGCPLHVEGDVPETRQPTMSELVLIREVLDPKGLRDREVPS